MVILYCVFQLRTHLSQIHKHQHQQRAINLDKPESQAMHLETRLVQLDSAIQMELWQVRDTTAMSFCKKNVRYVNLN